MNSSRQPLSISLFDSAKDYIGETSPVIRCTKAMLVHLSHSLEDMVFAEKLPGMLFAGFQEASYWLKETHRYRKLASIAKHITIFAGDPLPKQSEESRLYIELKPDDPLRQEWFLLILSDRFSVLLCGKDVSVSAQREAEREFDTLWTFDAAIISQMLDKIEGVIANYCPTCLPEIQATRQQFQPMTPEIELITQFTINFAMYEENLTRRLNWQRLLTDTLLRSIPHHLYVTELYADESVKTIYISPNIEVLTGYSEQEIGDAWMFWLEHGVLLEDQERLFSQPDWLKIGGDGVREYRFRRANNDIIWIKDSMHVVSEPETGKRIVYGVMEDITQAKQAEQTRLEQERLRVELEKERELSQLKTYFMRNISHEFRTPLSIILMASDNLIKYFDRMDDAQKLNKLSTISGSVDHLRNMLNDVSAVVNEDVVHTNFSPELTEVIRLTHTIVQECELIDSVGHTYEFMAEIPELQANIDITLFHQIMVNLLSNAAKFSPPDSVITVTVDYNDDSVILSVKDNGMGIKTNDQKRVFDAFFRSDKVSTISGLGLGLRIVLDCVELHQGLIKLDSVVNEGSTFTLFLPR